MPDDQSLPTFPLDLSSPSSVVSTLPHLLNVAELSSKYSLKSFERWAVDHILTVLESGAFWVPPEGFRFGSTPSSLSLGTASCLDPTPDTGDLNPDTLVSRVLLLALKGSHQRLLDTMTQKLMTRVLWHSYLPGPRLTSLLQTYGGKGGNESIRRLRGVTEYRGLISLPTRVSYRGRGKQGRQHPVFPKDMPVETRMRYLAAHHILVGVWDRLQSDAPPLPCSEYPPDSEMSCKHDGCVERWNDVWSVVSRAVDDASFGHPSSGNNAAVLGKLKSMVLLLKKVMMGPDSGICLQCSLGALEALALIRDSTIEALGDMFEYC